MFVSPRTFINYINYSNVVGDVKIWECYNTNKSAQGIKWFETDNFQMTRLMEETTARILNFTVKPSHNRHRYKCEIQGETIFSPILYVTGKIFISFLILWSNTC